MSSLWSTYFRCFKGYMDVRICIPLNTHLRWRKIPRRKPKWLPMAPSKVFRIPQHPFVPSDETELTNDLLDEYYRKVESIRKCFADELKQKSSDDGTALQKQQKEQEELYFLLEENKKENERVKSIREETMERLFQENLLNLFELEEERLLLQQQTKARVEEIVKKEKEKYLECVTYENLEAVIEQALDNPINMNYAITVNGDIKWEGNPPETFRKMLENKIAQGRQSASSSS